MYVQVDSPTGSSWVPATSTVAGGEFGATFIDNEPVAALTWSIDHNLNTTSPIVQVYSGNQVMIPASIRSISVNRTEITFAAATAGRAIISTGVGGPTSASFALEAASARTASFAQTASVLSEMPHFIYASQSADVTGMGSFSTITNWTSNLSNGIPTNGQSFGLTAGKLYEITYGAAATFTDSTAVAQMAVVDTATQNPITEVMLILQSNQRATSETNANVISFLHRPAASQNIRVRVFTISAGTMTQRARGSFIKIVEIR